MRAEHSQCAAAVRASAGRPRREVCGDARAALAGLKVHPRDEAENKAAIARGEKCFENFLGEQRYWVDEVLSRFMAALETQDPRVIETARKELHAALDQLEGETFL